MKSVIKIKPFSLDSRGYLSHLLPKETTITSALLIISKKGSIRANHYHKKDTHFVYLLNGAFEYCERKLSQKKARKKTTLIFPGDLVVTPPMTIHSMKFVKDSTMLALTTEPRDHKAYEKDTVRVNHF